MVDVGALWGLPVEYGSHHGKQCTPGGVQRDPFVRHAEAAGPDASPQVATGVGAEGGVQDVVGYVEPDEQPAPVWVVTGATDKAAVSGGDDLGGIVEMSRERVDFRALGSDDVGEDGLDERLLAREVVVERAEADVGLVRDLLDARAGDTLTGEQGSGGVEELRSCRLASPRLPIGAAVMTGREWSPRASPGLLRRRPPPGRPSG